MEEIDGWDDIPELNEVSSLIGELNSYKYEIDNCVKQTELNDLLHQMKEITRQLEENIDGIYSFYC
jgi:hypothetical protein|tara:strand:- start:458 stop:655 length:198 start_codon:yes stop_codon:yes gene_type:complete